jgi:hypothetical protein
MSIMHRVRRAARGAAPVFGLVCLVSALVLAVTPGRALADTQVTFMSGGAKGSWFRQLTAMSECLRQHSAINATVVPTQGGMDAFGKLQAGKADLGFTYQSVLYPAWKGTGRFDGKPLRDLRLVGVAERTAQAHWVVKPEIKSVNDLVGKRFAPGPVGTVTREVLTGFLAQLGILDEIDVANVSHGEMVSYLKDGKIDGWALLGGLPNPATTEAAVSGSVRLLDIGKEIDSSGFLKTNPFFVKAEIPAGTYPNIDYPVTTFAQNGVLVANAGVSDDLVYEITKVLWSDVCVDYLSSNVSALSQMKSDPLVGAVMPLHPGAMRYWNEKGLDTGKVPTPDTM